MEELEWWKLLGQQTRQSPYHDSPRGEVSLKEASAYLDKRGVSRTNQTPADTMNEGIPFESIATVAGGAIGFTSYVWTYPIVWLDGPLPIVDAFWLAGLAVSTGRGANAGRRIGQRLDTIEEVLL